ncbi:MAG: hypothetical protein FWE06_06020 [Oscillospiraceae bacterium]|nr:hypothetical protein [Oscillospiraceae bacterium]
MRNWQFQLLMCIIAILVIVVAPLVFIYGRMVNSSLVWLIPIVLVAGFWVFIIKVSKMSGEFLTMKDIKAMKMGECSSCKHEDTTGCPFYGRPKIEAGCDYWNK